MKYKTWQLLAASVTAGILGASMTLIAAPENPKPCIDNFRDGWLYYMAQTELIDIDETEAEKQFHDMIVSVVKKQNNLYVSKYGQEYVVPSYCYVEDTGLFVKLWRK